MNTDHRANDIIGIVKELQAEYQHLSTTLGDRTMAEADVLVGRYRANVLDAFTALAQALLIAEETLEDSANMPEYDQDDAHRLRDKAKTALSRIRSL